MNDARREEHELDDRVRALARQYHQPPETPRDAMWARIAARRGGAESLRPPAETAEVRVLPLRRRAMRMMAWVTGVAATLAVGIGIGRLSGAGGGESTGFPSLAGGAAATEPSMALQVATSQHLSRAEAFLTGFRSQSPDSGFTGQARDLLTSTRLLLDTRVVRDARTQALLQDLELILVQIVQLRPGDRPAERELITDGLEQRQVLPRLRTEVPAGPPRAAGA